MNLNVHNKLDRNTTEEYMILDIKVMLKWIVAIQNSQVDSRLLDIFSPLIQALIYTKSNFILCDLIL